MLGLQKMFSFLSFLPPIFHFKIHKRCGTFFERGFNSLKQTDVVGTYKKNRGVQWGRASKIENVDFRANLHF